METLGLLAAGAWSLDVAFFAILLLGAVFGIWLGFIRGLCKVAGTLFSVGVAITCCVAFSNSLESSFGLTTLLAESVNSLTIASWISVAVSFVALIVIVRLGAWVLGLLGKSIVKKISWMQKLDRFLGALLGLCEALLLIFLLLIICRWLPVPSLHEFIGSSSVVGGIFRSEWFQEIVSFMPFVS